MAGGVSIGPRIQVDGEEKYRKQINGIIEQSKTLDAEMKALTATFGDEDTAQQRAAKSTDLLNMQLEAARERTRLVREMTQKSAETTEENSTQTLKWRQALAAAEEQQAKLERAVAENTKALEDEGETAEETGQRITAGLGDSIDSIADKLGIHIPDAAKNALNGIDGFSVASVAQMAAVAGAVAGVIKVMSELHKLTLEAAAQADALLTQSAQTGLDVELLQQLEYASNFLDFEGIDQSLVKLTNSMDKAREGAAAQSAAFETLGVSVIETDGSLRNNYDTFLDVIDALGQVQNDTERDTLANDLFGKSYSELKPLIQAGTAELKKYTDAAKENGHVLTESQVKILGEVDDAHQELQATIEATKNKIAVEFAPASKAAMDTFSNAVKKGGDALIESGLIANTANLIENAAKLLDAGIDLASKIPDWMNPVKVASKDIELLNRAIKGTLDLLGLTEKEMKNYGGIGSDVFGATWKSDVQAWVTAGGTIITPDNINDIDKTTGKVTREFYSGNVVPGDVYAYGHMSEAEIERLLKKAGYNAAGDQNWRGGLTWLGEHGPELVDLPSGSRIYSNQESRQIAAAAPTDTRRLEQLQSEEIAIMHEIKSELAARRMLERMK